SCCIHIITGLPYIILALSYREGTYVRLATGSCRIEATHALLIRNPRRLLYFATRQSLMNSRLDRRELFLPREFDMTPVSYHGWRPDQCVQASASLLTMMNARTTILLTCRVKVLSIACRSPNASSRSVA